MLEWDGYNYDPLWVGFLVTYSEGDHRLTILSLIASLISFSIFTFLTSTAIKDICLENRSMTACLAFLTVVVSLALPFLVGGLYGVLLVNCPCYIQMATACRRWISKPVAVTEKADAAAQNALPTQNDTVSPAGGEDSEMQAEEEIFEIILWSSVPSEEELVSSL
ncbi:unnamed protein product [Symbiodinium sp. CCMP2592]|nr:unnamed protein product [Symbiodinium sp. CCMP2592]